MKSAPPPHASRCRAPGPHFDLSAIHGRGPGAPLSFLSHSVCVRSALTADAYFYALARTRGRRSGTSTCTRRQSRDAAGRMQFSFGKPPVNLGAAAARNASFGKAGSKPAGAGRRAVGFDFCLRPVCVTRARRLGTGRRPAELESDSDSVCVRSALTAGAHPDALARTRGRRGGASACVRRQTRDPAGPMQFSFGKPAVNLGAAAARNASFRKSPVQVGGRGGKAVLRFGKARLKSAGGQRKSRQSPVQTGGRWRPGTDKVHNRGIVPLLFSRI